MTSGAASFPGRGIATPHTIRNGSGGHVDAWQRFTLLDGFHRSGDGYMARCPCHDDNTASLSLKRVNDGTILVRCFAGCATTNVVQTLGLMMRDLFPPTPGWFKGQDYGFIADLYDYFEVDNTLQFQVVRTTNKKFPVRRPDGKGGWIWKQGDVRRILYKRPELLSADPEMEVYIPEG